ncbi:hypothetical protein HYT23_05220 [Candidatus Pacearchaeota archaeon]|nr:hypothetical protein [Candidatus Pacearchaeota archaeon]
MTKTLWEILVPRFSNEGEEYPTDYHKKWDEAIRSIVGGITILRTAKGHWISPDGKIFIEEMIPVRIHCDSKELERIMSYTLSYYNQEAVFAYELSSNVKILSKSSHPAK